MSFPRFCFITCSGLLFIFPFSICLFWRNCYFENETRMGKNNTVTLIRVEDAVYEPSQLFVKTGKAVMWFVDSLTEVNAIIANEHKSQSSVSQNYYCAVKYHKYDAVSSRSNQAHFPIDLYIECKLLGQILSMKCKGCTL